MRLGDLGNETVPREEARQSAFDAPALELVPGQANREPAHVVVQHSIDVHRAREARDRRERDPGRCRSAKTLRTCDFTTRTKVGIDNVLHKGQSIGAGFEPQAGPYNGMPVNDGKLTTSTEPDDELMEVDVATGDRKHLHKEGVTDISLEVGRGLSASGPQATLWEVV